MPKILFDPIPAERRDDVRAALLAAFGSAHPSALQAIIGGVSALTYRVEIVGRSYALRLEAGRGGLRDPHRSFACMSAAADASVSPPLRYADPIAGIAIMDFIDARPLADYPAGPEALALDFGRLIAGLQATPVFPALGDYLTVIERMVGFVSGSGLFAAGLLDPHQARLRAIRDAYPWDAAGLVSSHNDPNPRNLIFDGERLWLIDWETAFRNDPLVDMAIATHELAPTSELEDALLRGWLGHAPDPRLRARLTLMQAVTRLYYACLMLSRFAGTPPAEPHRDLAAPSVAEFRLALEQGRIKPGAPDLIFILGMMQLDGFLTAAAAPGFEKALVVARSG